MSEAVSILHTIKLMNDIWDGRCSLRTNNNNNNEEEMK